MKKVYLKPDAEYIRFYSEEELTDQTTDIDSCPVDEGTEGDGWID